MVKVGLAGIGFMGKTHWDAWQTVEGATVTALCESEEKKLAGDWSSIQGNFGSGGGQVDLTGIGKHRVLADMLADDSIDLIDLCLPTPLHPDAAVEALEAGKNVLCEKPIALNTREAKRMLAAADAHGGIFMVGHVLRFWPEWRWLKSKVDDGEYGKLVGLNIRRVISMPDWSRNVADLGANGGPLIDLHIHDVNFILYLLGMPQQVFATGQTKGDFINYVAANFHYPEGPTISAQSGAVTMKGRMFMHQYEAYFEQATVAHGSASEPDGIDYAAQQGASQRLTVYRPDGTAEFPELDLPEAFAAELTHASECVAAGRPSEIIDARNATRALGVIEDLAKSVRSAAPVRCEPVA